MLKQASSNEPQVYKGEQESQDESTKERGVTNEGQKLVKNWTT